MQDSLRVLLSECELFSGMSAVQVDAIAAIGTLRELDENDTLIEEKQRNRHLYIVAEGRFEILLPESLDRFTALELGMSEDGDAIGEYSFVDSLPAAATVRASERSRVLALDHEALRGLLDADSALAAQFYRNLVARLVRRLRSETAELDLFRP
jgi:CRP-like cAMP-binding protein